MNEENKFIRANLVRNKLKKNRAGKSSNWSEISRIYGNPTMIDILKKEITQSHTILIAVSFIKISGLQQLTSILEDSLKNGKKIQIVTTTYLNVTDPEALRKLLYWKREYKSNFDFRVIAKWKSKGFHMKSYIFKGNKNNTCIVGSSNITWAGLQHNEEWNLVFDLEDDATLYKSILEDFEDLWNHEKAESIDSDEWIKNYENLRKTHNIPISPNSVTYDSSQTYEEIDREKTILPRQSQIESLEKIIKDVILHNRKKGIIAAATGTGKTFLAAFFAKLMGFEKILYLAPSITIAENSRDAFEECWKKEVLFRPSKETRKLLKEANLDKNLKKSSSEISSQLLSGNHPYEGKDMIFSVYNSANIKISELFYKNKFDLIIVDEAHHSITKTNQSVLSKVKDSFILGLTATPFRTSENETKMLVEFFKENHNGVSFPHLLYKMDLFDAIEQGELSGFNYFAITLEGLEFTEKEKKSTTSKKYLEFASEESLFKTIKRYRWSGNKLRCLIFCVNKEHAKQLCDRINSHVSSNGEIVAKVIIDNTPGKERKDIIDHLECADNPLNYILSVNVLNEGIDIPSLNMVIFLRPTKSPIIQLQQLGRGLRKTDAKEHLTVFDFVRDSSQVRALTLSNIMFDNGLGNRLYGGSIENLNNGICNYEFVYFDKEKEFTKVDIEKDLFRNMDDLFKDSSNKLGHTIHEIEALNDKEAQIDELYAKGFHYLYLYYQKRKNAKKTYYSIVKEKSFSERIFTIPNEIMKVLAAIENSVPFCFYSDQKIYEQWARKGFQEVSAKEISESCKNEFPFANSEDDWIPLVNSFYTLVFESHNGLPLKKMREKRLDIDKDKGIIRIKGDFINLWKKYEQEIKKVTESTVEFSKMVFDELFANDQKNNLELKMGSLYTSHDIWFFCKKDERRKGNIMESVYKDKNKEPKAIIFSLRQNNKDSFNNMLVDNSTIWWCTQEKYKTSQTQLQKFINAGSVHVFVKQDYIKEIDVLKMYLGKWKIGDSHVDKKTGSIVFELKLEDPLSEDIFNFLKGIALSKSD